MFGDLGPLYPYMRRYRWGYVRGTLACVATNTVAVLFPTVLGMAVDAIKNGTTRRHILYFALLLVCLLYTSPASPNSTSADHAAI